jgi:SAM-dependent methyltransferase
LALLALLSLYPLRAWGDAPLFPTPAGALDALPPLLALGPEPRLLDAGCGAGQGLKALRRAWPGARLDGVERSRVLAAWTSLTCPWARVRCADLWADDWSAFDLVYLFQRPETMPRAWAKAVVEMRPGTWLVSLDFPVPQAVPFHGLTAAAGRPLWIYRIGGDNAPAPAQAGPAGADNPTGEGPPRPLKH